MNRHVAVFVGATLTAVGALMPPVDAARVGEWSEPVNLGPMINTPFDDAGPAISKDGLSLYFHSNRPPNLPADNDIYVARRQSIHHEWEPPEKLGPAVNSATGDSFAGLSRDDHSLFMTRPPGDLWMSYRRDVKDDFGWEPAVRLGPAINTDASENTGRTFVSRKYGLWQLYFTSTRPGGPGTFDIYVADAFGDARLVPELSSPQFDAGAVLSPNGLQVFFHSTRPGIGGRDLWASRRRSVFEAWDAPENMGADVNSPAEDHTPALSSDGDSLFFSSTRAGGFGFTDIYVTTRTRH